jgi:hypothetical protein
MIAPKGPSIDTPAMSDMPQGIARRGPSTPGDLLLRLPIVVALAVLLLNDHYLKAVSPGFITGKLSDFAGLAFFPGLLLGAWELILGVSGRWQRPTNRALAVCVAATAIAFVLVKIAPFAAGAFGWALGAAQWLLSLPVRLALGAPPGQISEVIVLPDSSDLVALVALAIPIWIGASRARSAGDGEAASLALAATR